jgi:serine dehydrogenase proteinase
MAFAERLKIIEEIEEIRQSKVICYLTSLRPNGGAQMSQDSVRVFFEHLLLLPERPVKKIDIFLCSNGGDSVVPWRLISLLREYADQIGMLIPFRAYSAATMLALGADEIVMHPFAEMGPIDPTVSNEFNPVDPTTMQRVGISVEDVKAYISFVKETVGIRHEDELVKPLEILAQKVHPLALGNVERFIAQSRMITRKILLTHMTEEKSKHEIDETIETLASKLYFHGHPINRKEARVELGLKVLENVPPNLEIAMWKLYKDFEGELRNSDVFDPMASIYNQFAAIQAPPPGHQAIVPLGTNATETARLAIIESVRQTSFYDIKRRFVVVNSGAQGEPLIRTETLAQGWDHQTAPKLTAQPGAPADQAT